ncbi:pyridoxamine 5'-phosphate oxidase [Kribbella qitaiheensis]|uniref:Pyridoxamine 5'-phosphate oxidase n=1 Tax=Kribbella qitaiheensis TaxID=1544730 RepID=A0A7G6XAF9_9ACTN|nr:pyridoxamine 5'-phosphate oxidase [Kribbella qitaiheensis]
MLVTLRESGEPATSVVNSGIVRHPVTGADVVAFVARGNTAKTRYLRRRPHATLVFRAGWEWVSVDGEVELAGPDDRLDGLDADGLTKLLRDIYLAAGGQHEDLDEYDRAMARERRTAVLVSPRRFRTNPTGTEHQEHG